MPPRRRSSRARASPDRERVEDELRDVSASEAYGFAAMCLTATGFCVWLFCVFASVETLERFGAPSGRALRHYARVLPIWTFAAMIYAFIGYECLNLMATPDDFQERFGARVPHPSEYAVSDPALATRHFEPFPTEITSEVPLFRDLLQSEITRRMFATRAPEGEELEPRAAKSTTTATARARTTRSSARKSG